MKRHAILWGSLLCVILLAGLIWPVAAAPKKVTLTLWCLSFELHKNGFERVAKAFIEKHPNITIKVQPQADLPTQIKAALAAKNAPDMFTPRAEDMMEMVLARAIEPFPADVLSVEELKAKHWPEYYLQAPFDKVYAVGIPDPIGDAGLVVNVDFLKEAGLAIPEEFESLDQMLDYAKKLTKIDASGKLIRAGLSCREYNNSVFAWDFIAEQGGKFYDNATGKFDFTIPESKKAIEFFYDLHHKYKVDSLDLPDSFDALSQKVAAMAFMWAEYVRFAKTIYPDLNFTLVVKPSFVKGRQPIFTHIDTWNLAVWAGSKHKAEALEFIKFLKTKEAQMLFLEENPGISPLRELAKPEYYKNPERSFLMPLLKHLPNMRFWGPFGNDSMIKDSFYRTMDAIEHKSLGLDEGLAKMTKDANEAVARFRDRYPNAPKPKLQW
ncbi:MAG: extracellular solute-binding protein [Firmicutes bacterium]|nr:extracellular solute-binding protein [Bacillota bacterium]